MPECRRRVYLKMTNGAALTRRLMSVTGGGGAASMLGEEEEEEVQMVHKVEDLSDMSTHLEI